MRMKLNLLGVEYLVEEKHLDDSQGETHLDRQVIYIDPTYPLEARRMTLVHELGHVINEYRLRYCFEAVKEISDVGLREHLVLDPFANGLYEVLKANSQLRKFLWGGNK